MGRCTRATNLKVNKWKPVIELIYFILYMVSFSSKIFYFLKKRSDFAKPQFQNINVQPVSNSSTAVMGSCFPSSSLASTIAHFGKCMRTWCFSIKGKYTKLQHQKEWEQLKQKTCPLQITSFSFSLYPKKKSIGLSTHFLMVRLKPRSYGQGQNLLNKWISN